MIWQLLETLTLAVPCSRRVLVGYKKSVISSLVGHAYLHEYFAAISFYVGAWNKVV